MTFQKIIELRTKICRTLQRSTQKRKGLEAVANFEVTTRRGKPINRVHCHFLTDDPRSAEELKEFFTLACERCGLVEGEDFRIKTRPLWNGKKYFDYFTKYGKKHRDKVILFKKMKRVKNTEPTEKGAKPTRLQKFFQIGKWFKKPKMQIRKEIRAFGKAIAEIKERAAREGRSGLEEIAALRFGLE